MKSKTNFKQMYLVDHKCHPTTHHLMGGSKQVYNNEHPTPTPPRGYTTSDMMYNKQYNTSHQTDSLSDLNQISTLKNHTERETKLNNKNTPGHTTEASAQTTPIPVGRVGVQTTPPMVEAGVQTTPNTTETGTDMCTSCSQTSTQTQPLGIFYPPSLPPPPQAQLMPPPTSTPPQQPQLMPPPPQLISHPPHPQLIPHPSHPQLMPPPHPQLMPPSQTQLMPPPTLSALPPPTSTPPSQLQLIPPTILSSLPASTSTPPPQLQLIPPTSSPALPAPTLYHTLTTTTPTQLIPPPPLSTNQYSIHQRVLAPQPMDIDKQVVKYICTLCETNFETRSALMRHNQNIHEAFSQTVKGDKRKSEFKTPSIQKRTKKTENTYGGPLQITST